MSQLIQNGRLTDDGKEVYDMLCSKLTDLLKHHNSLELESVALLAVFDSITKGTSHACLCQNVPRRHQLHDVRASGVQ
jgi:hypothetical protein